MTNVKEILKKIEVSCNDVVPKLELLNMAEDDHENIQNELQKIKEKLEKDEITKFSYATMLESNKKKEEDTINNKKKIWDEIASIINTISDELNELKEVYNNKTENEGLPELSETKTEEKKK